MKKFTKKFLNKFPHQVINAAEHNAKRAEKLLGIKQQMWREFSNFSQTNLAKSDAIGGMPISFLNVKSLVDTSFLAGFVCGWAEKSKKIK